MTEGAYVLLDSGDVGDLWCWPRAASGIPLRACCARTRPLSLGRKGTGCCWLPAMWRSAVVAPLRPGHPPLTAFAPPYAEAKGARLPASVLVDSCLRRNDGGGGGGAE